MATQTIRGMDGELELAGAVVGNLTGWTLDERVDTDEVTVIGDSGKRFEATLFHWTGRADALFHHDLHGQIEAGQSIKLRLHPEGDHLGEYREGDCIIDSIGRRADTSSLYSITFSFRGSGVVVDQSGGTGPPVARLYGYAGSNAAIGLPTSALPSAFTRVDFTGAYSHRIEVEVPAGEYWLCLVPTGREPTEIVTESVVDLDGSKFLSTRRADYCGY